MKMNDVLQRFNPRLISAILILTEHGLLSFLVKSVCLDVLSPVCVNTDRTLDIHVYMEANHSWENLATYQTKFSSWIIVLDLL